MCDLKPDNMYMSSNGDIDIGDFGGALEIGETIIEYTPDYLPEDIQSIALPKVDLICLVTSILKMKKIPFDTKSVEYVKSAVDKLDKSDLQSFLLELF